MTPAIHVYFRPQKQTEQLTASLRKKHQNPKVNLHDSLLEMPINLIPTILKKKTSSKSAYSI